MDGLAAAGDGRSALRQNSREWQASFIGSNKTDKMMERIVGLLCQLL